MRNRGQVGSPHRRRLYVIPFTQAAFPKRSFPLRRVKRHWCHGSIDSFITRWASGNLAPARNTFVTLPGRGRLPLHIRIAAHSVNIATTRRGSPLRINSWHDQTTAGPKNSVRAPRASSGEGEWDQWYVSKGLLHWNGELSRIPDTEPHPTMSTLDGPRLHWEVLLPSWPLEASADPQLRSLRGPVPQELFVEAEI